MRTWLIVWALFFSSEYALAQIPDRAVVQMARGKATVASQTATILLKAGTGGRKVSGGTAWFENHHVDDWAEVYVTDEDNILGLGAGTVVGGYTDTSVAADNKGWYFSPSGLVTIEKLVDLGTLQAGLYLKIVGHKGDNTADTLRLNIHWGAPY